MKNNKRILSGFLALLMFLSVTSISFFAYAEGTGSVDNPYRISTAQQLQDINNNLTANYILVNDIDLSGMDFEPIGNAEVGTFQGVFDGNGYTISNLDVYAGKYAGLFGCNEGTIKNVTLKDIFVYGTRYVGGVVGENANCGIVDNCICLFGNIEGDYAINSVYIGGICGNNQGNIVNCTNYINIDVDLSVDSKSAIGGIIGCSENGVVNYCCNKGNISNESSPKVPVSGGIVGYAKNNLTVMNSNNIGSICSLRVSGGIVGRIKENYDSSLVINNCYNSGYIYQYQSQDVNDSYSGGIVGDSGNSMVSIKHCYNNGKCSSYAYNEHRITAGIIAYCSGNLIIDSTYNDGVIENYWGYCGGIVGYCGGNYNSIVITNTFNTGNLITGTTYSSFSGRCGYVGGIVGSSKSTIKEISNCYSSCYMEGYSISKLLDNETCYEKSFYYDGYKNEHAYKNSFDKNTELWDFENIWSIDSKISDGNPMLINCSSPLKISNSFILMVKGDNFKLNAYRDGDIVNSITWKVVDGNVSISSDGVITATESGYATVAAIDKFGNKVNCNIYVMNKNTGAVLNDFDINVGQTLDKTITMETRDDYLINATSGDDNILKIESFHGASISFMAKSPGTTTISFETAQGVKGSCIATVTNIATSISLPSSSVTINRGESRVLNATTSPAGNDSIVKWTSSNESVVTVDQNGLITAVGIGTATIMVQTDNGLGASCTVTIKAPATSINYVNNNIKVALGETYKLSTVVSPADSTDCITFREGDNDIVNVYSDGRVYAKSVGTTYVTATTTSGKTAKCYVTVVNETLDLELSENGHSMNIGDSFTLSAIIIPDNASNKSIAWSSSNPTIAEVSADGVVTANSAGKTIIRAESYNGIIKCCEITVSGKLDRLQPRIYIPNISDKNNEYIDVPVIIENNPGISFASINVSYDRERLEPVEVTNGTIFNSVTGSFDKDNSQVKLYFTNDTDVTENGNLAFIKFKVLKTEETSTLVKVMYLPGAIRNANDDNVSLNLSDGRIEIELCIHDNTELRNAKEATCTEQGYSGDLYCLDCGDLLEKGEFIDMIPHSYEETIVEATENKKGYTKHLCTVCGYSYIDNITDYASDNSVLLAALAQIESYSAEDYSKDSYDALMSVYDSYSNLRNQNISQIEIDNAVFDLLTAISGLEPYLNLNVSAPNGTFTVSYNNESNSNTKHSLLFGTEITLSATANEGYEFVGWYDTINNLYFSKNAEYSFKLTSNTSLKAVFVKEQSASLIFTTYSNWVQSTVTKTIDEWNSITSIDSLLPAVPYKYGYSNGRWAYNNETVLAKLQTGENVYLIPEYDEDDTSLPTPPSPKGDTPVLDLYYKLDADANVGSFVMAAGIPKDCKLESVGVAFYYKKANEFDPTKFELLINNQMLVSRFNTDEIEDIYIVNLNKLTSTYNWAVRGYVTYYDADGNLKTAYSNQVNIVDREQM